MTELSTTRLADLIAKRRRCLEQLLELGRRQAELIAAGNMADLMRLLAAKQQLIAALQTLEKELAPFHDEDPDSRRWASPEDARALRGRRRPVPAVDSGSDGDGASRRTADDGASRRSGGPVASGRRRGRVREAYQSQR